MGDLPPRTWRSWWLAWPRWFRIGCWAALGLALINATVAVRIIVGLMEPSEITELRSRCRRLEYFWEWDPKWFPQHHTILAGLYGKSWRNIKTVASNRLTVADLRMLRLSSPLLRGLSLDDGIDLTPELLAELAQCRQLTDVSLGYTEIDDEGVQALAALKNLTSLSLGCTLVTDEALRVIEHLPLLEQLDADATDVTEAAIQAWKNRREALMFSRHIKVENEDILAAIGWSDGTRSPGVPQGFGYRTIWSEPGKPPFTYASAAGLPRANIRWNASTFRQGDGDYTMELRIGDYDATPVTMTVKDGKPSCRSTEFVMPCTKVEALRSAKSE